MLLVLVAFTPFGLDLRNFGESAVVLLVLGLIAAVLDIATLPVIMWRERMNWKILAFGVVAVVLAFAYLWIMYRILFAITSI